jgi:hypothetical protein
VNLDPVLRAFLVRQEAEGAALAAASDLLELVPIGAEPASLYLATFRCKGLVRAADGAVRESDRFEVGIAFPPDYLRRIDPIEVVTWLGPRNVFHPNISDRGPFICVGRLAPGMPLVDLLYQVFEIITYQKVTMREDDALNADACAWARRHRDRLPVDRRPLKRRALALQINPAGGGLDVASVDGGPDVASPSGGLDVASPSGRLDVTSPGGGLDVTSPGGGHRVDR